MRAALFAAGALGVDPAALAQRWDFARALSDVDARFPHLSWLLLWQDLAERTGCESVGIEAAQRLPWGHWDVIDYLLGTSATLATGLGRFERYFPLISTAVSHTLERTGEHVQLVRRYRPDCATSLLAPAEFAFASTLLRLRRALGDDGFAPLSVHFAAPAPADADAQRRLFGCPVRFGQAVSAMIFEASALGLPFREPDPELCRILERHAEQLLGNVNAPVGFVESVRAAVLAALRDGDVSVPRLARQLGMSARTLQRRLAEHDTRFEDLLDRTRHDLALRYLCDPGLSIQETAHLLGFGDLRGFYRAFQRWQGTTPATYRKLASAR